MRKLVGIAAAIVLILSVGWWARSRAPAPEPLAPLEATSPESTQRDADGARDERTALDRPPPRVAAAPAAARESATDPETSSILGRVATAHGESPAGFTVRLALHGKSWSQVVGAGGRFEFPQLAAGSHTLAWSRPATSGAGQTPRTQVVELGRAEAKDVVIDAGPSAPCAIDVTVTGNEPAAAEAFVVALVARPDGQEFRLDFGPVDEYGRRAGLVEGDVDARLVLYDSRGVLPMFLDADALHATPGGRLTRELRVALATLELVLPTTSTDTDADRVELTLNFPLLPAYVFEHSVPHGARGQINEGLFQENGVVRVTRLPASECDVELFFPAIVAHATNSTVKGPPDPPRHPTFQKRVTLRPGAVTRVDVP